MQSPLYATCFRCMRETILEFFGMHGTALGEHDVRQQFAGLAIEHDIKLVFMLYTQTCDSQIIIFTENTMGPLASPVQCPGGGQGALPPEAEGLL